MRRDTGGSRKTVRGSDLRDGALGIGDPASADRSAGNGARYATIDLTGGGGAVGTSKEYDVPHDLGKVPSVVELTTTENAAVAGTVIQAVESRRWNWSHAHVHVMLTLLGGSFDGCSATFRVRGA